MRISLLFLVFNLSVLYLSAQSGYSNLEFVENKGQWDTTIRFRAQMSVGSFYLRSDGYSVLLHDTADMRRIHHLLHGERVAGSGGTGKGATVIANGAKPDPNPSQPGNDGGGPGGSGNRDFTLHSHLYHVRFVNANPHPEIVPEKAMPSYNNYLVGDRKRWASKARLYLGVTYKNIYNGIDIHYYTNEGVLKYDIIIHPGADPSQIILNYEGADGLSIRKGQLLVKTSVSTVTELEPRTYQVDEKGRTPVACSYVIREGKKVSFKLKDYSPGATLVIDPTQIFCSFTGSRSDNWGYTSTYDNFGAFYAGGIVVDYGSSFSGDNFGVTSGAFQQHYAGGDGSEGRVPNSSTDYDFDVAIMKFNPTGSAVVYATYLGGSGDEQPHSMVCDGAGNLVVTGRTTSNGDFPVYPSSLLPHATQGFDLFVTKFNSDGSGLMGSQIIGGTGDDGVNYRPKYVAPLDGTQELRLNYGDDGRGEVILGANNNVYVVTCTKSGDFPMVGAFQTTSSGQEGVIIKLSADLQTLMASSYFGGNASDALFSVAINPRAGDLFVSGGTMSSNLPKTAGTYGAAFHGGVDGFVANILDNGNSFSLVRSTYVGTNGTDIVYGLQFDNAGFPYITGTTTKVIPVVNSPFNQGGQASGKQFITKLKPDLSGVVYSANFGPGNTAYPNLSITAFLVDRCENVYVSGWGGGIDKSESYLNSGTNGLTPTAGALKSGTDGEDFYFFVLQRNAASQLYGSFFGQPGGALGDHVDGGTSRFDKQGVIYQSICANCYGPARIFPVTSGAAHTSNGTGTEGCNEAAVKIAFNFTGVFAGLKLSLDGRGDTLGCAPLTVTLRDTVHRAKRYIWTFGDGTPDLTTTSNEQVHTYTAVGIYRVRLIGIDSNTCNIADTVYQNITVKDSRATLAFDYAKVGACTDLNYEFYNQSTPSPGVPFKDTSFVWIFGDNPGQIIPGGAVTDVVQHRFPSPGTYDVSLILRDTNYCNAPDTLKKQVYVATTVVASIGTPLIGCAPYYAHFDNNSLGGKTYLWEFGDGTSSTDRVPPDHFYPDTGRYTIKLTVTDPNTCNKVDDTVITIHLLPKPSGDYTWTPMPPVPNTRTVFTPISSSDDVVKWEWLFGDGTSTVKLTPDTAEHQYQRTDTFHACLVVFNNLGCTDTVCHDVPTLINPLLDVPNAFTPGRFGENSIVRVYGFGIVKMSFKIYNRWGQMVFQSNDPYIGWDGYYKGSLQAMDVYAYTLEAEFFDGKHVTKKGDITLVR